MIKCFVFEDFKSFDKAVLWLEQITTMIGTNASGKSNAIEGIQILSEMATGRELSTILDGTKNSESSIRGGAKGCCRFKSKSFTIGCSVDYDAEHDLLYKVKIGVDSRITVDEESLYFVPNGSITATATNRKLVFKASASKANDSGDVRVEYNNGKQGKNPIVSCIRNMSVLSQINSKIPADCSNYSDLTIAINKVRENLLRVFILEPVPLVMRGYNRIGDSTLKRDCSNISPVLYALSQNSKDWKILIDIVRSLPENEVKGIEFVKTLLQDVVFILKEENGKVYENIDAARVSDGTLRCIAIVAALMSEPEHSLIVFEEVDNGIHPSRARKLIDVIFSLARKREIDLILTTHNVTILNSYKKNEIIGVSVLYRDSGTGASCIIPFVDIQNYAGVLASGGIGNAIETELILKLIKE